MTRIYHSGDGSRRFLFWDEQNRLKGFGQDDRVGHYRYDAHGERYFKWTGEAAWMNYNGRILRRMWFSSPTLYASPYLVATPQGYTKHYYAGMDRIASRIGGGGLIELGMEPWELDMKKQQVTEAAYRFYEEDLGLRDMDIVENLSVLYEYEGRVHDGNECYFYHTDQIGSSNWITNQDGLPVQHLQYLPFGEPWIDQRTSEWNSHYTFYPEFIEGFSGKERDAETGLSYFGARYYDSDLSIWLSADPLADNGPSISPYAYCFNNPIKMVDPNGKWPFSGVVYRFFKGGAGLGVGFALSATQQSGIANDRRGITHFVMSSINHINNQNLHDSSENPSFYVGGEASISAGVAYNWGAKSFIDALSDISVSTSLSGKAIIGGEVGIGENSISLSVGLGAGAGMNVGAMSVDQSISLSKAEANKISKMTDVISESWIVGDTKAKYENGKISGFAGTVYTKDSKGNRLNTGISVTSGYTISEDGSKAKSNNIWISKEY